MWNKLRSYSTFDSWKVQTLQSIYYTVYIPSYWQIKHLKGILNVFKSFIANKSSWHSLITVPLCLNISNDPVLLNITLQSWMNVSCVCMYLLQFIELPVLKSKEILTKIQKNRLKLATLFLLLFFLSISKETA